MQTIFWCAFSRKKIVDSNFIKLLYKGQIDNDAALVQVIARCWTGVKSLSESMMTRFYDTYIYVIRSQCVSRGPHNVNYLVTKPTIELLAAAKTLLQFRGSYDLFTNYEYSLFDWYQLIHWGRDKMAAIFKATFLNGFSGMKMYVFRLRFHWSLFLGVQLAILQHWFR